MAAQAIKSFSITYSDQVKKSFETTVLNALIKHCTKHVKGVKYIATEEKGCIHDSHTSDCMGVVSKRNENNVDCLITKCTKYA